MNARGWPAALCWLLLGAAATGQEPTLHGAWLREMLDADCEGAARAYGQISTSSRQESSRWLAAARLVELQRLGAARGVTGPAQDQVPEPLRRAFEDARRPEEPVRSVRPLVGQVAVWAIDLIGFGNNQRRRLLQQKLQKAWTDRNQEQFNAIQREISALGRARDQSLQREQGLVVLAAELGDQRDNADRLRTRFFRGMPPPERPADAVAGVRLARERLREMRDTATRPGEKGLLQRLDERLAQMPAEQAVELLMRLPVFGHRLLAPG